MTETVEPVRVAINVMRARLTVVAFTLAMISLQLAVLPRLPGAVELPGSGLSLHIGTDITLLLGLAFSVVSLMMFIISSEFDEQGSCTHWSLVAGDLFMFLGLAQAVSGFFAPFTGLLRLAEIDGAETLRFTLLLIGGATWSLAMYVGPVLSLLRSPFGRTANRGLWAGYLALLLLVAAVNWQATQLQARQAGHDVGLVSTLANSFVAPFSW